MTIGGHTRDGKGAPVGNCAVSLYLTSTNVLEQTTTSDGNGIFSFTVADTQQRYVIAYLAGTPDISGTSLNTLQGS